MGEQSTSTSLGTFIMKEVKHVKTHYMYWRVWFQGRPPSIEVKIEMAMVDSSRARTPPSKKFGSRPSFPLSCDPSRPSFWERRPTCPKTPRIYKRLKDGPLHSHLTFEHELSRHSMTDNPKKGSAKSMYWSEACTLQRQGTRLAPAQLIAEQ